MIALPCGRDDNVDELIRYEDKIFPVQPCHVKLKQFIRLQTFLRISSPRVKTSVHVLLKSNSEELITAENDRTVSTLHSTGVFYILYASSGGSVGSRNKV